MKLVVDEIGMELNKKSLMKDISFHVNEGEYVGIIGPNGSGKSTLLKTVYRVLNPTSGVVMLDNEIHTSYSNKDFARKVAVAGQESSVPFDFSVEDIVLMGRNPHKRFLENETHIDREIVRKALEDVGLHGYGQRSFTTLSGGEKQRVIIARVIAQQPSFFILDEPTNHLDVHHQLHILDVLKQSKLTVLTALHDLNLAASYCDRLLVMQDGKLIANGCPSEILTKQLLKEVFQVNATIWTHPITNKVQVMYVSQGMRQGAYEEELIKWLQR
ncbi:ABC transporter ATP-binding protein [Alkalihalophilus marmarensis]|uniref:ABC transporter ATP-binding protein n=1 Tax=Alkalihalophilus marmarensis TaxID=521377 RepID=UPI002DBC1015|nr:ABC transporter ATP-binding protein [Alkalihalophilus marmarensis]MEC2072253.1 ABC transporter ATP-binding protein [Alkalihalophilus marmarensis]